jgi:hypothetical protein
MISRKILIPFVILCFASAAALNCSKEEEPVLRAYDAKNHKMIVLSGTQTKTKNFYEKADFVVVGGSLGGIAAALALCSNGRVVILVEESDRIAGCFSVPDTLSFAEGELVEKTGSSQNYQIFRSKIMEWYKKQSLSPPSIAPDFNPAMGNFRFRNFCFGTEAALDVINEMLEKNEKNGKLTVLYRHKIAKVTTFKNRIASFIAVDLDNKVADMVSGWYFIDASIQGDLLVKSGINTVTGMESKSDTHEPHAPEKADSLVSQEFYICPEYTIGKKTKIRNEASLYDVKKVNAPGNTGVYEFSVMTEPRRIIAETRISEEDISAENQKGPRARFVKDSIGIGYTFITVNLPDGQRASIETKPFQIPFGALIPLRFENVLAGNGNIGATYIAASALKTPEIEWAIGEAAGTAAALLGGFKVPTQTMLTDPEKLRFLQRYLVDKFGAPIYWYDDVSNKDEDFEKAQLQPFENPAYHDSTHTLHYHQSK